MSRGKKRPKRRQATPPNRRQVRRSKSGCENDPKDEPFLNGLDHTAYHAAEKMQEVTSTWTATMFAGIGIDDLSPTSRVDVKGPEEMKLLGEYILKWMHWLLARAVPLWQWGTTSVKILEVEGAMPYLIVGYELPTSRED